MYEHGHVLAVNNMVLGSELVADHAAGVEALTVQDAADFDEDGGWLKVGSHVIEYTSVDDDEGVITLMHGLPTAFAEGDEVAVWDDLRKTVTTEKVAQVELDGLDDNVDPLEAVVPLRLLNDLEEGIRGAKGESVLLELDGDEWRIADLLGLAAESASGVHFYQHRHTVFGNGDTMVLLPHTPADHSEHLYINGVQYTESEGWSRTNAVVTIASALVREGDLVTVEYAYVAVNATPPVSIEIIPFGSPGWTYLPNLPNSDSTDYSSPTYDDSAWAVKAMPMSWDAGKRLKLWARKWFPPCRDVFLHITVEDHGNAYVNGNLVVSLPYKGDGVANDDLSQTYPVPPEFLNTNAPNLLAFEAIDDSYNRTNLDIDLWGVPVL